MKVDILGVKVDNINYKQAIELIQRYIEDSKQGFPTDKKHYIVTPNPEFIVAAQTDMEFKQILNNADLAIPDGFGLKLAHSSLNRVTGIDLIHRLCQLAQSKGFSISLLGAKAGIAKQAAIKLKQLYPQLKINFADSGGDIEINSLKYIDIPKSDILLVALGQIKQEKWIAKNLPKLPIKVAIGVGGAFDYISGNIPRAPKLIRQIGLEWLFRLIIEPWRFKRQLKLFRYVYLIIKSKLL